MNTAENVMQGATVIGSGDWLGIAINNIQIK
jgi:hypothetical protein